MERELPSQEETKPVLAQQVRLISLPERVLLQTLADEVEQRLDQCGSPATVLLYGITPKRREGFVILEAARGIPLALQQWLAGDARVLDYTVNDVASIQQEREAFPAEWYQSRLSAPALPEGYTPLAEPASVDSPGDERWLGLVVGDEGEGMLFYEEKRPLLFLTSEESLVATLQFSRLSRTLLDLCDSGFAQAHARDLAALQRDLTSRWRVAEEAHDA